MISFKHYLKERSGMPGHKDDPGPPPGHMKRPTKDRQTQLSNARIRELQKLGVSQELLKMMGWKIKEYDNEPEKHHSEGTATVTYQKGVYGQDFHRKEVDIEVPRVDVEKGFKRTTNSTQIAVEKHPKHKEMVGRGYSIDRISHPNTDH